MRNIDRIDTLRGAYEAPRCDMVEICAERGLCLSNGATHGGFSEEEHSGWQN